MKRIDKAKSIPTNFIIRRSAIITIVVDVILMSALVVCLSIYISNNNVSTFEQNIENITSITRSEAELMKAIMNNNRAEVTHAYNYCNGKSIDDILDYLSLIAPNDEYQLLKRDEQASAELFNVYNGYSTIKTDGSYTSIQYKNNALVNSIYKHSDLPHGEICFSQSFTNKTDALAYFAVFCSLLVDENGTKAEYYVAQLQKEADILAELQIYSEYTQYSQYSDLALAICYTDGKYMACDSGYRANNFYDYLYKYNDLSIDERNLIRASVQNDPDGSGVLEYNDYKNRSCVFVYASCSSSENWQVIVSVPIESFVTDALFQLFPTIIIIFLVILLLFNTWRLLIIVNELRRSVTREQIANSAKSSFLSRMSHEIRTPLNAIIGYNNIIKSSLTDAKDEVKRRQILMKVQDCLGKSEIASKHLLSIINDVLDMSAIESGKIKISNERFDFKSLIVSLTTVFYSQAKAKNVAFEVIFDTIIEEWFISDQMRVNQILTNLLSNAIKFTPENGSVTLRISQSDTDSETSVVQFKIIDTGIGMTDEYIHHIWTPFEQADSTISRRFGGTGLGLSITKNLIDLMGGTITITSELGVGSVFAVDLRFDRTEQPQDINCHNFDAVNALVIDSDADARKYAELLFSHCNIRCNVVASGKDALRGISSAEKKGYPYTLYLVNWQLSDMDGVEAVYRIRHVIGNASPSFALVVYDYSEVASKALEAGIASFISKPLFPSSLRALVGELTGAQDKTPSAPEKTIDFTDERVLLAEDNSMNMEIAKTILNSAGLDVDNVWNGKEAVELFINSPPGTYMAILMDIHMPEMNGHDASFAIRASEHPEAKTIPIIAMTADVFAEDVAEARAAGMNAHIGKPIDISELFGVLGKYVKPRRKLF